MAKPPLSEKAKRAVTAALTASPSPSPSRTPEAPWIKLIVSFREVPDLCVAMPIARALQPRSVRLYFARYTNPPGPRVEIQVQTRYPRQVLDKTIYATCKRWKVQRPRIQAEPCNGSVTHATMFEVAVKMEQQGVGSLEQVADLAHWLSNMLGYTYAQEGEKALRTAHLCFANALGVHKLPVFNNPLLKTARPKLSELLKEIEPAPKKRAHKSCKTK